MNYKKSLIALTCAAMAGLSGQVHAGEGRYGAIMASAVVRDSDLPLKTGYGVQALTGGPLSSSLGWEANIYYSHNDVDGLPGSVPSFGGGLDLRYLIGSGGVQPFLLAGAGGQRDDFADLAAPNQSSPFIDLGVGLLAPVSGTTSLRTELRAYALRYDQFPGSKTAFDWRLNFGLSFGGSKATAGVAAAPMAEPAAPAAAAPAPVAEPAAAAPPKPAAVTPAPAAAPAPALVVERFALQGVTFAYRSDKIEPTSAPMLDAVVATLKAHPEVKKIQIDGYTDSTGDAKRNQALSERRAKSVMKYFIDHGIAASRLSARGHGAKDPIASNATEAGRASNRRVELRVK